MRGTRVLIEASKSTCSAGEEGPGCMQECRGYLLGQWEAYSYHWLIVITSCLARTQDRNDALALVVFCRLLQPLMVLSVAPFASPFPILASVPIAHFSDFSSTKCCAVQFDGKCYIFRTIKRYGTAEPFPWCCLRLTMSFLPREKRYASYTNLIILSKQAGCIDVDNVIFLSGI